MKTKYHVIGSVPRQLYNKAVRYVEFEIDGNRPVRVIPAYHSKIKGELIYEKYSQTVSRTESIVYGIAKILLMPIFSLFGVTIKTGETVTEKAIHKNGFITVAGRLKANNGELAIVPDFIAPKLSNIQNYLAGKAVWVLIGQTIFISLSAVLWIYSIKRENDLKKSKKALSGNRNLKCSQCENPCNVFFEPCLDIVLCSTCSQSIQTCPKCSKPITHQIPIHLS